MFYGIRFISVISLIVFIVMSSNAYPGERILTNPYPEQKNFEPPLPDAKDWNITIGGGAMCGPAYEGSNKYVISVLPEISVEYSNGLFFANFWDGIGSYPLRGENYKLGASIGFDLGRQEDNDTNNLRGMGNIDMEATVNLMGEYDFGPLQLSGKITRGTMKYGTTANLELGTMYPVTERIMIMGSVGATWADEEHMTNYFGVSSTQSRRSGYSRYNANTGIKSVGFSVGALYSTEKWTTKLIFMGTQLVNNAADSPITKNEFNPSIFMTIGYKFSF